MFVDASLVGGRAKYVPESTSVGVVAIHTQCGGRVPVTRLPLNLCCMLLGVFVCQWPPAAAAAGKADVGVVVHCGSASD